MNADVLVPLLLEAVEQLNTELMRIHHNVRGVVAWPTNSDAEIQSIRAAVRRAFAVTRSIHTYALIEDEMSSEDVRASSLRARAVVMAVRSSDLERASRGVLGFHPIGRFQSIPAFKEYVLGQIGRINAAWIAEVKEAPARHLWNPRETLGRAEAAYRELGRDPDVAAFLDWAIARGPVPLSEGCVEIARILDVPTPTRIPMSDDEVPALPPLGRSAASNKKN